MVLTRLAELPKSRRFILAVDPERPPEGLEGAVFAIGNFDGLHRGHKAVLLRAQALAQAKQKAAAVLTFEPHPSDYFAGGGTIFRLTPLDTKAGLVERLGVDGMVVLTFDSRLANLSAEAFVRNILVERLNAGAVVAGYDFHFGKMRGGTPTFLREAGERYGFDVEIIEKISADAEGELETASSTATRVALEAGGRCEGRDTALGIPFQSPGPFNQANVLAAPWVFRRRTWLQIRAAVFAMAYMPSVRK